MSKKALVTEWYVEPKGGFTNEVIFDYLNQMGAGSAENTEFGILDDKGESHDVIRVEHRVITVINKNRQTFGLAFTVFYRRKGASRIRERKFENRSPFRARKELSKQLRRLEQLNKDKK